MRARIFGARIFHESRMTQKSCLIEISMKVVLSKNPAKCTKIEKLFSSKILPRPNQDFWSIVTFRNPEVSWTPKIPKVFT